MAGALQFVHCTRCTIVLKDKGTAVCRNRSVCARGTQCSRRLIGQASAARRSRSLTEIMGRDSDHRDDNLHLYSLDIDATSQATELFGREKGLLVCRPRRFIRPWFAVPEGCYALVTQFGQDKNHPSGSPVWPPGVRLCCACRMLQSASVSHVPCLPCLPCLAVRCLASQPMCLADCPMFMRRLSHARFFSSISATHPGPRSATS